MDTSESNPQAKASRDWQRAVRVTREYPEPVADLAAAWFDAWHSPRGRGREAFDRLLDAFEYTTCFVSLLAVVEYLRLRSVAGDDATDALVQRLRSGQRLPTGYWWQLLDGCLGALDAHVGQMFCPELHDYYRLRRHAANRLLDALPEIRNKIRDDHPAVPGVDPSIANVPHVRNRMRGHGLTLPESRYREIVDGFKPVLDEEYDRLEFLRKLCLLRVLDVADVAGEDGGFGWQVVAADHTGSSWRASCRTVQLHAPGATESNGRPALGLEVRPPQVGELLFARSDDQDAAGTFVSLHPLVIHRAATGGLGEVALYQGRHTDRQRLFHLGVRFGAWSEDPALASHLDRLLQAEPRSDPALTAKLPVARSRRQDVETLADVVRLAADVTGALLWRMEQDGVYLPDAYVERDVAAAHVDAWIRSDTERLLILTGLAGSGKTSMACRTASRLRESDPRHLILLLNAPDLPVRRLETAIAGQLGMDGLVELARQWTAAAWRDRPARAVIIVDSADRHADPTALLEGLLRLARRTDFGCKFMITCALPVLEAARSTIDSVETVRMLHPDPLGPVGGRAVLVDALRPDDAARAYDAYRGRQGTRPLTPWSELPAPVRRAMCSPLVLRLATEAWDGERIPLDADEIQIFVESTRRSLFSDIASHDFVKHLVAEFAGPEPYPPSRSLPLDRVLDNPRLRDGVLANNGPYRQLLDRGVLVTTSRRAEGDQLSLPRTHVEFAFDGTLGYLLLAFDLERKRPLEKLIPHYAIHAGQFAPMGFALDLALRQLGHGEEAADVLAALLQQRDSQAGVEGVVRYLAWADTRNPATGQTVVGEMTRGDTDPAVDFDWISAFSPGVRGWLLEQVSLDVAAAGVAAPDEDRAAEELADLVDALMVRRVQAGRLLEAAWALAERGRPLVAALIGATLVRRQQERMAPPELRQAQLLAAKGLSHLGTRRAVDLGRALANKAVPPKGAPRDANSRRSVLVTAYELCARLVGDDGPAVAALAEDMRRRSKSAAVTAAEREELDALAAELAHPGESSLQRLLAATESPSVRGRLMLVQARSLGGAEKLAGLVRAIDSLKAGGDLEHCAQAELALGRLYGAAYEPGKALATYADARLHAETAGREDLALDALIEEAGGTVLWRRDGRAARELLRRHARLAVEARDPRQLQMCMRRWGNAASEEGDDYQAARSGEAWDEVLAGMARAGYDVATDRGVYHENQGEYLAKIGSLEEAERVVRRGVGLVEQLPEGDRQAELPWIKKSVSEVLATWALLDRIDRCGAATAGPRALEARDLLAQCVRDRGDAAATEDNWLEQFACVEAKAWLGSPDPADHSEAARRLEAHLARLEVPDVHGLVRDAPLATRRKLDCWLAYALCEADPARARELAAADKDQDPHKLLDPAQSEQPVALLAWAIALARLAEQSLGEDASKLRRESQGRARQAEQMVLDRAPGSADPVASLRYLRRNPVSRAIRLFTGRAQADDREWEMLGGGDLPRPEGDPAPNGQSASGCSVIA